MAGRTATSARTSTSASSRRAPTSSPAPSCPTTRSGRTSPRSGSRSTTGKLLPQRFAGGAFIGEHGSWNRRPLSGYKVVFVPFADGRPKGQPEDVLTGFVNSEGEAHGRPVGVAVDRSGALLVADDVGNIVWRVSPRTG